MTTALTWRKNLACYRQVAQAGRGGEGDADMQTPFVAADPNECTSYAIDRSTAALSYGGTDKHELRKPEGFTRRRRQQPDGKRRISLGGNWISRRESSAGQTPRLSHRRRARRQARAVSASAKGPGTVAPAAALCPPPPNFRTSDCNRAPSGYES